ncbi:hypothetical protein CYLTODRAFT_120229 [Cylindrobasidium torrendii FP15055 ss-10]|uniref:Uncharacterized protein n=1 Tax=Cylindrobasidium torrendii FP15055 ss-10 TaxID=1314674 RepID=A0A0D7AZV5_9AGAR|nr:hypothetical protein CYLTODRAFT_120229 [Cylindrobasidium torrendii FP15055 ss-10]
MSSSSSSWSHDSSAQCSALCWSYSSSARSRSRVYSSSTYSSSAECPRSWSSTSPASSSCPWCPRTHTNPPNTSPPPRIVPCCSTSNANLTHLFRAALASSHASVFSVHCCARLLPATPVFVAPAKDVRFEGASHPTTPHTSPLTPSFLPFHSSFFLPASSSSTRTVLSAFSRSARVWRVVGRG